MFDAIYQFFKSVDSFFWGYVAFGLIMVLGALITVRSRFFQLREFPRICKTFFQLLGRQEGERGVHPIKAFMASVGGMIGIGNVVGIATAIQLGGPGALVWVWIAGMIGAIIKYCEIYLGLKYRQENGEGSYDGGPMFFLRKAFKMGWIPVVVAVLLCIYGVEIYQFSVITESVSSNFPVSRIGVIGVLLALVLYASLGGVKRIGRIATWVMPFFMATYLIMTFWILGHEMGALPGILSTVFKSAFTGHAAIGGFAGASIILAIQQGISRAAYSADLGIGYDSIIQSESSTVYPQRQARLAILGVFFDNLVCTLSILLVLVTGVWTLDVPGSELVQTALSRYFPYMHVFIPLFFVIVGFTTLNAYFTVGIKCARFLLPKRGKILYILYGVSTFILFSFLDQTKALLVMSISGALLMAFNLLGIYRLRKDVSFVSEDAPELAEIQESKI